ncbi:2-oxo-4-hydroxy-4-carboxy-5-ureidoimidazoline decarboxylase [Subtercola boreus]|uniref:2-oxo-4-hydroxy-4-carboxy-5-ureidoimidazoline decarboxylase n=1 Tax=Subtercola boreus TaxID=120213 RepID=UPI0011759052|nr:2-oxo-4-hydroxy-4-carboxy-5-ureidoimidazoline decarboxylase [Subtercola boreus]TQL54373.1 2-oxo-4-hydroxy-4-carboxy-5-ureidoimidazoline decarboxylase [Subtercola boreus]
MKAPLRPKLGLPSVDQEVTLLNLQASELRELLIPCLAVPRWVDELVDAAPYNSREALLQTARRAATPLTPDEIAEALAEHPRIGETPVGEGAAQSFSRGEQASSDSDDVVVNAAIASGNAEYERRFDRVFLIRAKGRSRAEILVELQRRMQLDDSEDIAIVGSELADIALLRLESSLETLS